MKSYKKEIGFSLIELSIVLGILGLVFVGFTSGIGSFKHSENINESQTNLANIKKQVLNFGVINKYIPCPDTDGDGLENRDASVCHDTKGNVPYLDIGLKESDVEDAWGNKIRYAVNTDTVNPALICDKTSAASMFCNAGSVSAGAAVGTFWFNAVDTPPFTSNRGDGNYYICNDKATTCSGTPPSKNLESDTASVVLVAFNEDGAKTLNNCGATTGATHENCDVDLYYQQAARSYSDSNFFDDVITSISGNEIKAKLLASSVSWNSYTPASSVNSLTPTYESFDISPTEYANHKDEIETADDDVISVNRNVSTALNLGDGNDNIAIGNNLESGANLTTGSGDDSVYIVGEALSAIDLGSGDDQFVLGTDLAKDLSADSGNDKVWIQGNVVEGTTQTTTTSTDIGSPYTSRTGLRNEPSTGTTVSEPVTTTIGNVTRTTVETTTISSESYRSGWRTRWNEITQVTTDTTDVTTVSGMPVLDLGSDNDVLWLGQSSDPSSGDLEGPIYGGSGYDILVLENMTKDEWDADSSFQNNVNDFELVVFKSVDGTREYEVL